jgi:hypothetical protein
MARQKSDTVDYFPHFANASAGDTLTVLQARYKNDGYAFWFKLLERLCASDGHYLDLRCDSKWNIFSAKMGVSIQTTIEIMNLLVEMGSIDKELWELRIVWCRNLVKNLADVYRNRKREPPQKPVIIIENGITTIKINNVPLENDISTNGKLPSSPHTPYYPKTKVKGEERERKLVNPSQIYIYPKTIEGIIQAFQEYFQDHKNGEACPGLSEDMENELRGAAQTFSPKAVMDAMYIALKRKKPTWDYVTGILNTQRREDKK